MPEAHVHVIIWLSTGSGILLFLFNDLCLMIFQQVFCITCLICNSNLCNIYTTNICFILIRYLHEICEPPIIHRNFKSANVLLDEELAVHVSECGLASLITSGAVSQVNIMIPCQSTCNLYTNLGMKMLLVHICTDLMLAIL